MKKSNTSKIKPLNTQLQEKVKLEEAELNTVSAGEDKKRRSTFGYIIE